MFLKYCEILDGFTPIHFKRLYLATLTCNCSKIERLHYIKYFGVLIDSTFLPMALKKAMLEWLSNQFDPRSENNSKFNIQTPVSIMYQNELQLLKPYHIVLTL